MKTADERLLKSAGEHYDKGMDICKKKKLENQWTLAIDEFDKAIEDYEKIQKRDKDTIEDLASAYRQRSECYLKVRDINKAWMDVQAALGLNKFAYAWHTMALIHMHEAEYQKALDCLKAACRLKPKEGLFHHNMGVCHKKLGNDAVAKRCYEEAKRLGHYEEDFEDAF